MERERVTAAADSTSGSAAATTRGWVAHPRDTADRMVPCRAHARAEGGGHGRAMACHGEARRGMQQLQRRCR
jgi:hypothetical protein